MTWRIMWSDFSFLKCYWLLGSIKNSSLWKTVAWFNIDNDFIFNTTNSQCGSKNFLSLKTFSYVQHSGFFHMALGCWGLLTFGPQVCKGYGSFTFFLIYILGGISGNLTSFLHTAEPTVGGTVRTLQLHFLLFIV